MTLALILLLGAAHAMDVQQLTLGYDIGLMHMSTDRPTLVAQDLSAGGRMQGVVIDYRMYRAEDTDRDIPLLSTGFEFAGGGKHLQAELADGTELVTMSDEDAVAEFAALNAWVELAPWSFEAGPVMIGPLAGVQMKLVSYAYRFSLWELDATAYGENDFLSSPSYGDFVGPVIGAYVRWSDLLGSAKIAWTPHGPLLASGQPPQTTTAIAAGGGSSTSQVQAGAPLQARFNVTWDRFFLFNPGLSYEVGTWGVKPEGSGDTSPFRNGHQAVFLTLAFGFFPGG